MILNNYNTGVTVELRELIEAGVKLWDFEYPIPANEIEYNGKTAKVDFDKKTFEQKIIDHFYFRQIGQETVGRFLHCFRTKIREIMPYYVQLYEFDAIFRNIEDPLESYHLEETLDRLQKNKATSKAGTSGTSIFSDTPQGRIENIDDHMTNATKDTGSSDASSDGSTDEKYTLVKRGNIGVQPLGGEVENIRHAFINIDLQIIEDLNDLFLKIY